MKEEKKKSCCAQNGRTVLLTSPAQKVGEIAKKKKNPNPQVERIVMETLAYRFVRIDRRLIDWIDI